MIVSKLDLKVTAKSSKFNSAAENINKINELFYGEAIYN